MPATTDALIMLYVDTATIIGLDPTDTSQANLDAIADCCILSSNNTDSQSPTEGSNDPNSRRNFETDLKNNSQIAWVGAVLDIGNNLNDYVLISSIVLTQDGIGIVLGNPQPGNIPGRGMQPGSGDTHIDGIVRQNPPPGGNGSETEYKLIFTVCHGQNVKDGYQIDPKLKMNN